MATGVTVPTADAEAPAGSLDVRVLGPIEVYRDGDLVRLGGPKQQTVLGLLVAAAGRAVSAETLIDGLWGEDPPSTARGTLQSHVSGLRAAVGEAIVWKGGTYRLDVARGDVDAWRFEDEVSAARGLVATDPLVAVERLRRALDLWRGHPYAGSGGSAPLAAEARRLEELRLGTTEDCIEAELALGRHAELVAELETLAAEHPLRERLRGQQMLALYRSGRQAEALEVYTRLRETLAEELGLDPSPELRRLEQLILTQAAELEQTPGEASTGESEQVFLFTDLEGSTPLWDLHPESMEEAVAAHDALLRTAIESRGGKVVKWTGDGVLAVLPTVDAAAGVACEAQRELAGRSWGPIEGLAVRVAIDSGPAQERDGDFFGAVLNRCARLLGAAHGGQVLLSETAQAGLSEESDCSTTDLGEHRLKGFGRPQRVFQLGAEGLVSEFPALRMDGTGGVTGFAWLGAVETLVRGYQLGQRVGEGDFGVVYRALQTSVQREVAVKVIRPEYANRPVFIRRFEAEAQFVAQLEHPHVVSLYDYWRDPDGAYLVMPFMRGGSLADALRRGPWSLGPALRLLDQVGAALSYAHRNGIVHRDVKPGNILLDEDGNAYLSDFGIASRLYDDANAPMTTSLSYVPPEELRGESLGPRSDVFSLAVLTFELLTGIRPTSRELPALGEARADLPAELGTVLRVATDDDPQARYEKVEDFLRAVRQAVGADVVSVAAAEPRGDRGAPTRNPFKGLRAFQETDAADFYGREALVDELLQAVSRHRLVAVVGASGSGKSSVVRAGLLPALRAGGLPGSRGWLFADMFPGSYPFEELEAALLRVAVTHPGGMLEELRSDERGILRMTKQILPPDESELVLVVDQFEELFSLVDDEATRRLYLDALRVLVTDERSRVRVVVTMRADFFDRPLDYPGFSDLFKAALVPVTAPSDESLGQAISRPARSVGLDLEPGLVGEITADVQNQPGALPLLQYALTELFQRRDGDTLTIDGYRATGGVLAALGRRAEEIYGGLPPAGQEAARHLFLRLVNVDEETDDTRRRVSQGELDGMDVEPRVLETVIQQFAAYRLLAFDRDAATRIPTVEVAHEALIREWPRLHGWIDDQRQNLVFHRRLQATLREWVESERDPSFLLRGARLESAERWADSGEIALSRQEAEYLEASREQRTAEEAEARRRRRRVVVGLAVGLVVALVLAAVALAQSRLAAAEARVSEARAAAATAATEIETDPERAVLLALEAVELVREAGGAALVEATDALRRALVASRVELRLPGGDFVAYSADGSAIVTGHEGGAALWDAQTGELLHALPAPEGLQATGASFAPNGAHVVVAFDGPPDVTEATVTVWDVTNGNLTATMDGPGWPWPANVAHTADGRLVAVTGNNRDAEIIYDLDAGAPLHTLDGVGAVALAGSILAVATDGEILLHDARSLEEVGRFSTDGFVVQNLILDPTGGRLAATSQISRGVRIWDVATGEVVRDLAAPRPVAFAWAPPDGPLGDVGAVSGDDGIPVVYDLVSGTPLLSLPSQSSVVWSISFNDVGDRLAAADLGGDTLVWDVTPAGAREVATIATAHSNVFRFAFDAAGALVVVSHVTDITGQVDRLDAETGRVLGSITGQMAEFFTAPIPLPDAGLVGAIDEDGSAWLAEIETLERIADLPAGWYAMAVSPDRQRVLLVEDTWPPTAPVIAEFGSWRTIAELDPEMVGFVEFSPDGTLLALASPATGRAWLVDVTTGETLTELGGDALPLRFDRTGGRIAVAFDGTVRVLDVEALLRGATPEDATNLELLAHSGLIVGLDFSPDGRSIATASFEGTARVWDAETGARLAELPTGLTEAPPFVTFSPDGRHIFAKGDGGTIRRFTLDLDELVAIAQARLTRALTDGECSTYLRRDSC